MLNVRIFRIKKITNIEIRDDGLLKKRIETILAQEKNLRIIEINKLKIKRCGSFSNVNRSQNMSLKIPFISRIFFQKTAHNREYIKKHCIELDKKFNFICC